MKKFLFIFLIAFSGALFAQDLDTVNIGTGPNSRNGDPLRTAFIKINNLFHRVNTMYSDSIYLASVAPLLKDTMLIASYTVGQTDATDTTLFTYGDTPFIIPWEGSHSLVLTKVKCTVVGSSPDIDIAVLKDVNQYDANPTEVLSADLTVTSTTTGSSTTSFASGTILSGDYVWIRIDQTTAQPTQLTVSFYGYLLP